MFFIPNCIISEITQKNEQKKRSEKGTINEPDMFLFFICVVAGGHFQGRPEGMFSTGFHPLGTGRVFFLNPGHKDMGLQVVV